MIQIDFLILHCRTCDTKRRVDVSPPLLGAKQLDEFLKSGAVPRCACGADRTDVMFPVKEVPQA